MATYLTVNGVQYDLDVTFNVGSRAYADPTPGVGLRPFLDDLRLELLNRGVVKSSSVTSNAIGTGSKTFVLADTATFVAGQLVIIANTATPANYFFGQVTSYTAGTKTLVVNVSETGGSGTFASWNVSVSGVKGATGPATNTYADNLFEVFNATTTTKRFEFDASVITAGQTRVLTVPDSNGTLVLLTLAQTLINKTLDNTTVLTIRDSNLTLQDDADTTKQAKFELSGIATGTTRTLTFPNANGTLALVADVTAAVAAIPSQSTTAPGLVELGTAAEVKTGTDANRVSPIGLLVQHPSSVKAYARVSNTGVVTASFGIASVVRNSAGNYTFTFSTAFATADYVAIGAVSDAGGCTGSVRTNTKTTTTCNMFVWGTCDSGNYAFDWGIEAAFMGAW